MPLWTQRQSLRCGDKKPAPRGKWSDEETAPATEVLARPSCLLVPLPPCPAAHARELGGKAQEVSHCSCSRHATPAAPKLSLMAREQAKTKRDEIQVIRRRPRRVGGRATVSFWLLPIRFARRIAPSSFPPSPPSHLPPCPNAPPTTAALAHRVHTSHGCAIAISAGKG